MFKYYNLLIYLLIAGFTLLLQGCATVADESFLRSYEATYRKAVAYRTHRVQRGNFVLSVREYGRRTGQPTLVMMHGFPDSMHLYDRLVPLLADKRHIITFDFLGWGYSDKPLDHRYDVASLRQDLEDVIAHFALEQVVLVLHDASGQPGIDWSLDNPTKTAGLVLLNTYYGPSPTLRAPDAIARFSTPGIARDLAVWFTRNFDYLWLRGYNKQIGKFISTESLREPFQKLLGYQSLQIRPAFYGLNRVLNDEIKKRQDKMAQLKAFQVPVRIIFGNDDKDLNAGVARTFHALFPDSELFLIDGAGHFVQVDKPAAVADLLNDFPLPR
jgi:pimeloyl-ACP methyl ester carboxylesterase